MSEKTGFFRKILVVLGLFVPVLVVAPSEPVKATRPTAGVYIGRKGFFDGIYPGAQLTAAKRNWPLPLGVTSTNTWYRCDSYHAAVEFTTTTISIPADCSAISGATNIDYTIDSHVAAGTNLDEGKFITVLTEDNASTPNRALAETVGNFVIVNRTGGTTAANGMRIIMANGAFQVYRENTAQIYPFGTNTPGSSGVAMTAEGKLIVPQDPSSNGANNLWDSISWSGLTSETSWDSSRTELVQDDVTNGSFIARTVFSKTFAGTRTYELTVQLSYTRPSQLATVDFFVTVPSSAPQAVKLYFAADMYLDGDDYGPGTTMLFGTHRFLGQYNYTGFGGLLEGTGPAFDSWVEDFYTCAFGFSQSGMSCNTAYGPTGNFSIPYPNTINSSRVDAGVAGMWTIGTTAGTFTRQLKLAFAKSVAPSINASYSQNAVGTNKEILTFIDVVNSFNTERVTDVNFELSLPSGTYGTPSSTCDGTVSINVVAGTQILKLLGGNLISGDSNNERLLNKCQISLPTTFTTAGTKTMDSTRLISSSWTSTNSSGSLSNLLSDQVEVTVGGVNAITYSATVTTNDATNIDKTSATLNGQVTATGVPAQTEFCFGIDSGLSSCSLVNADPSTVAPADGNKNVSANLVGLSPGVTYYYRLVARNGAVTNGSIKSFTTNNCWETLSGGNIGVNERVLRFTYSPTACNWPVPTGVSSVQALVVAGGGGGGAPCVGGGGGAGGVRYQPAVSVSGTISITIGQGGAGGPASGCAGGRGTAGGNTVFGSITSIGGGGGGSYNAGFNGGSGGSGGGGSGGAGGSTLGTHYGAGGTGNVGQGNDGANGDHDTFGNAGGGGGGAGSSGASPVNDFGGSGGAGYQTDISGTNEFYGGGGGGGSDLSGKGGIGGSSCGGNGATGTEVATAGTGYGCGGGGGNGGNRGAGGSDGVVIIRYTVPPTPTTTTTSTTVPPSVTTTTSAITTTTSPQLNNSSQQTSSVVSSQQRFGTVYFKAESPKLDWRTIAELTALLPSIKNSRSVFVLGYTHREGQLGSAHSRRLSLLRAQNVAWWLRKNGVSVTLTKGLANRVLVSKTNPSLNRRVVVAWKS